ncbi:hypothetical protein QBC40DRAFT_24960 [Triangularia verruculosa]|uniref:Putative transcription factor kapC n=1 Tax=Triangularia verruculosa TaxID=2587418 RepID=A0AAN6X6Y1_9PEZI|nr:hypothetical protein QBC40DRAFT_24960 [Triangularia verruculosa]
MEDFGSSIDMPSPSNSLYYVYGDGEHYSSGSQSPSNSTYDMASTSDFTSFANVYPSTEHDEESGQPDQEQKPTAKRKRENRYKNAPPSVLSRRRAQNRASQRAYRERKDQRIKDLEQMLHDAKQRNDVLNQAYTALHAEYISLRRSRLDDQQFHHQQPDLTYSNPHQGMGLETTGTEALDMDLFVYPDLNPGYSLN